MSTIGENIKKCRIERGMTQKKLSELLNVSQNAVHNWETGKREPNMSILHQIAQILDKSIILLIDGDEENHPLSADDYAKDLYNSMTDEEKQAKTYYFDEKTSQTAQEIFENKQLSLLFDAAKDASPEDLETVNTMLLALKNKDKKTE